MAYGITPACAGKSRVVQFNLSLILGSPPHVRGKANSAAGLVLLTGITPACAGKSRVVQFNLSLILGSPPHVRGKANSAAGLVLLTGITPACAGKRGAGRMGGTGTQDHPRMCGKSVSWYVMTSSTWDHLRVCGEKAGAAGCRSCREGSPPRMRGKVSPGSCY